MKINKFLLGGILLALLLFLAACSSQPTQDQTQKVNDTTTDLGTEEKVTQTPVTATTPPVEETIVETQAPIELSAPKVSIDSIQAYGSRYDSKYIFNQLIINFTSNVELDLNKLTIFGGNKYYNATLTYNESINCSKSTDLIKNRNKQFTTEGSSTKGTICMSPARDLGASDTLNLIATYDGKVVFEEPIKMPSATVSAYLRLK